MCVFRMVLLDKVFCTLKPVLNWAHVCSLNILWTVRRTMIRFLIKLLVRWTWFIQFSELRSQLAFNEMQASAQTCGRRAADSMIENVGESEVKSVYFHHPSQGNSTNYYLILGLRDKAAPPPSQQINKFPPKRVKNLPTPSSIFLFFIFSSSTGNNIRPVKNGL